MSRPKAVEAETNRQRLARNKRYGTLISKEKRRLKRKRDDYVHRQNEARERRRWWGR